MSNASAVPDMSTSSLRALIRQILHEENKANPESDTDSERTQDASLLPLNPPPPPFTSRWYRQMYPHQVAHNDTPREHKYPGFFRITDANHLSTFNKSAPEGVSREADVLYQTSSWLTHCLNMLENTHSNMAGKDAGNVAHVWRCMRGVEQMMRTRYDLIVALRKNDEDVARGLENVCKTSVGVSDAALYVQAQIVAGADEKKRKLESDAGRRVRAKHENGIKKEMLIKENAAEEISDAMDAEVEVVKETPVPKQREVRERDRTSARKKDSARANGSSGGKGRRQSGRAGKAVLEVDTSPTTPEPRQKGKGNGSRRDSTRLSRSTAIIPASASASASRRPVRNALGSPTKPPTPKIGDTFNFTYILRSFDTITTKTVLSTWHSFAGLRWSLVIFPKGDKDSNHISVYLRCGGVTTDGRVTRRTPMMAGAKYKIGITSTIRALKADSPVAKQVYGGDGSVEIEHDLLDTGTTPYKKAGAVSTEYCGTGVHQFSEKSVVAGFPQLMPLKMVRSGGYANEKGDVVIVAFVKVTPEK